MSEVFHPGERELQTLAGVRERIGAFGARVIRDHMPDQHREFFTLLPFVLVGSVDAAGQPHASLLAGPPGFIDSPDAWHLRILALPLPGDPLHGHLREGASLGLLGIQPHTRRRNRMNGVVSEVTATGFTVSVEHSFGNCPKYIQARSADFVPGAADMAVTHGHSLDAAARALLSGADTFFIATAWQARATDPRVEPGQGVDISHRGGAPGFVRVIDDRHFELPDYSGNQYFNTLGNLRLDPRAALLFADFGTGEMLHLTVTASVTTQPEALARFAGAERVMSLELHELTRLRGFMPLRWGAPQWSPFLPGLAPDRSASRG